MNSLKKQFMWYRKHKKQNNKGKLTLIYIGEAHNK